MAWRPSASLALIQQRALVYQKIRAFFSDSSCLEVDTPLLQQYSNTDVNIESIEARVCGQTRYLQTSPEFAMKRLLAAGSGSIYQICHAFRDGERGRRHNPEFNLLEWYRIDFDYHQLMDEIEQLVCHLGGQGIEFSRISYADLFRQHLGFDPLAISAESLRTICAQKISGTDSSDLSFDQCLDLLLALLIEPEMTGYQFVFDYPASQASLARLKPGNPDLAERFELFYNGIELANGFSELTDADTQRERFLRDCEFRQHSDLQGYAIDENLLAALEEGLPECAGVALGLDRLLMVLTGHDSIQSVLTFHD